MGNIYSNSDDGDDIRQPQDPETRYRLGVRLLNAAMDGDMKQLKQLIHSYPYLVKFSDIDSRSGLHIAASYGHAQLVRFLLDHGANPHAVDKEKRRPIEDARDGNHTGVVRILNPFERESGGYFLKLCTEGDLSSVEKHLESYPSDYRFADIDKRTGLHVAVEHGHLPVVELLVKSGANILVADRWKRTALDEAQRNGRTDILDILRAHSGYYDLGANFLHIVQDGNLNQVKDHIKEHPYHINFADVDNRTALHVAACFGHAGITQFLVDKGADPNMTDWLRRRAIDDARDCGHDAVVNALLPFERLTGSRFLLLCKEGSVAAVKKHIELYPSDLKFVDFDKRTGLHLATTHGRVDLVEFILRKEANVLAKDRWGFTPMDLAVKGGHQPVVDFLRAHSVSVIQTAAEAGDIEDGDYGLGIRLLHLIKNHADFSLIENHLQTHPHQVHFADYDKRTPLHISACAGNLQALRLLLKLGANPSVVDLKNNRPYQDAFRHQHEPVVDELLSLEEKRGGVFLKLCGAGTTTEEAVRVHLQDHPEDAMYADHDNRTGLHVAATHGSLEVVNVLVNQGALLNIKDIWDHTPLMAAEEAYNIKVVDFLRGLEGNPNEDDVVNEQRCIGVRCVRQ